MGMFTSLFGEKQSYPPLPPDNYANARLREVRNELAKLASETNQPLEVVPAEHAAYVFIGKPPKTFGFAWIHDGKVSGFKTLADEHGINPVKLQRISDDLRKVYEQSADATRYQTQIADRDVVVTPSSALEQGVDQVIETVLAH